MSKNYIVINGKKMKLTEEQLKLLGLKINNPFMRVTENDKYFAIEGDGVIAAYKDTCGFDDRRYENANYFNDESFAKQVALHQLLYRKLLKFAYENECEDTQPWDGDTLHWYIEYDYEAHGFFCNRCYRKTFGVYFSTEECANRAIEEVIKPFMKEHSEFVW